MVRSRICDFCLDEPKGLFNRPEELLDKHHICKNCRRIIESYDLPVKYDLFQLLVTSEPEMREMQMGTYLESHKPEDCIARFFPLPATPLHKGERCINTCRTSIRVKSAMIPDATAVPTVSAITRNDIVNLQSASGKDSVTVNGTLFHTDAALYFISDHFINCHRLANVIRDNPDTSVIHVLEGTRSYTYPVSHADLFFMRESFFNKIMAKLKKKKNLIYIASENTMTITPGVYSVGRNIQAGTYYVSALDDKGLRVRDAAGGVQRWNNGRIQLDEGSRLEVTGEYQFRINQREELEDVLEDIENTAALTAQKD